MEKRGGALHMVREPQTILKIAMLLNISESKGHVLSTSTCLRAVKILENVHGANKDLISAISTSQKAELQRVILDSVRRRGGLISRTQLTRALYGKARSVKELDEAMEFLIRANHLRCFEKTDQMTKKSTIYYRITSKLEEDIQ
jgi:hypothetical protein